MDERKKAIKYRVWTTLIVVLLFAIASTIGVIYWLNSGVMKLSARITEDMQSVKTLVSDVTVTDSGVKVYGYTKSVTVNGANAEIQTVIGKLTPNSLDYQETVDYAFAEGIDKNELFKLNVSGYLADYKEENGVVTGLVRKNNVGKFFGSKDLIASTDAPVRMVFDESDNLTSLTLEFSLESGKILTLTATYTY